MKPEKRKNPDPARFPEDSDDLLAPGEEEEDALYHHVYFASEDWEDREFCYETTPWD